MKNLFKTILPYKRAALLVLLLMIGQAYCEMNLPMYTQNLIDTGIQNRGIEHILPEAIRRGEYDAVSGYMDPDQLKAWESSYEMADAYMDTGDDMIYYRTVNDEDKLTELDALLLEPIVTRYSDRLPGSAMTDEEMNGSGEVTMMAYGSGDEEGPDGEIDRNLLAMGIQYAGDCDEDAGLDMLAIQNRYMWRTGGMMILMSVIVMAFTTGIAFIAARVGASIGRNLRSRLFSNVMSFSSAEISLFQTSSLITRATNDIQQVQMTVTMALRMMLFAPCICIWSIIKVYQTHAHMNYIIVVGVIAILLMVICLFRVAMPRFRIMQTLVDNLNAVSREILTGIQVIRAFGREKTEEKRFDKANKDLYKNQLFVNRTMISISPFLMIIMYGLSVWITWTAAGKIDTGDLQVGAMTAFISYSMEIVFSFLMIASMAIFLPRAGVAADRLYEVLETASSITDSEEAADLRAAVSSDKGSEDMSDKNQAARGLPVRFSHVSFRYPDAEENVLTDIDFEARPGETTAIIGATGCGKTTLISLIPRFFDVTEGSITIGGCDVRDVTLRSLRNAIGYVPQRGILFSGTIEDNLRWGDENASGEELREAAEIAQALEFIDEKQDGFESAISQGGSNVSGGQKQRLAIARAVVKHPPVMIFDDSFSALDMKTDAALRKALERKTADSTRIIVAQRVGTILDAEQIIVLDEGRIAGKGTHRELLQNCEIYRDIARSQLSEAELGI